MIKTILFDLDDTILDFHKAERIALKKTLQKLGIEPTDEIAERYSEINDAQWKLLELGKITRYEVLTRRFTILFKELGVECSGDKAWQCYENLLGEGYYFIDGAEDVLKALSPYYNLYLVSNGTASVQDKRIAGAGIKNYFKDIFISQRIGHNKPSKHFFEYCFKKMSDFVHNETIIIGDSLTSDIKGGLNAGIATCWFNPAKKENKTDIIPEYEIDRLEQLQELLRKV